MAISILLLNARLARFLTPPRAMLLLSIPVILLVLTLMSSRPDRLFETDGADLSLDEMALRAELYAGRLPASRKAPTPSRPFGLSDSLRGQLDALCVGPRCKAGRARKGLPKGWKRTETGLLVLPVDAIHLEKHPLEILIEEAEARAKSAEALRPPDLSAAVGLYRSLFQSDPPLGFDKWFSAFNFNPSILPPVRESFLPFLSVPGNILKARLSRLDDKIQTFYIDFQGGAIKGTGGKESGGGRARDLLSLLKPVAHLIPADIRVYFNVDDVPRFIAHNEVWNASVSFGSQGLIWPEKERSALERQQKGTHGWHYPCPRDSPVGRMHRDAILKPAPIENTASAPSFIVDHKKAMDYCLDPALVAQHGLFLYGSPQPDDLIPLFSTCRTYWSMDIPTTPLEAVKQDVDAIPWANKTKAKAFWRGKMTGLWASKALDWRSSQRHRLHFFTHPSASATEREDKVEIFLPNDLGTGWTRTEVSKREMLERWVDVGLVDGPLLCDEKDGTCAEMADEIEFAPPVEWNHGDLSQQYQFVIDVDGNGWSSRLRRLLLGGSVVLKSTVYPEWYSDIFIPYYHYVPLKNDYSDLLDLLSFLTARPRLAERIGARGRQFVLDHWQWEDMQAYMALLLLEYARVMSDDREAMSYRLVEV